MVPILVVRSALAVLAWLPQPAPMKARVATHEAVPAGSVYAKDVKFQLAVYHLSKPTRDPDGVVRDLLRTRFPYLHVLGETPSPPAVFIGHPTLAEYAPPDAEMLKLFGADVSPKDAQRLQHPALITVLGFGANRADALRVLRDAHTIMLELATATDGLIWDDETRQIFTPASWKSRRLDG